MPTIIVIFYKKLFGTAGRLVWNFICIVPRAVHNNFGPLGTCYVNLGIEKQKKDFKSRAVLKTLPGPLVLVPISAALIIPNNTWLVFASWLGFVPPCGGNGNSHTHVLCSKPSLHCHKRPWEVVNKKRFWCHAFGAMQMKYIYIYIIEILYCTPKQNFCANL